MFSGGPGAGWGCSCSPTRPRHRALYGWAAGTPRPSQGWQPWRGRDAGARPTSRTLGMMSPHPAAGSGPCQRRGPHAGISVSTS